MAKQETQSRSVNLGFIGLMNGPQRVYALYDMVKSEISFVRAWKRRVRNWNLQRVKTASNTPPNRHRSKRSALVVFTYFCCSIPMWHGANIAGITSQNVTFAT
jgi:hypothetical protein